VIGSRVHFAYGVSLTVIPGATLVIENDVYVGRGVVISAHKLVTLCEHSMLAEYVCIHDNNHQISDSSQPIASRPFVSEACVVGKNVWLGAGVKLVKGASVGDCSVVGAGAVVTKALPANGIFVGIPAREVERSALTELD